MKKGILVIAVCLNCLFLYGQSILAPWSNVQDEKSIVSSRSNSFLPTKYRLVQASLPDLARKLGNCPDESTVKTNESGFIIELPMETEENQLFRVVSSSIMEPKLALKYPDIRTFLVQGISDPSANGRLDVTPEGFHAMIRSSTGILFIDPYTKGNTNVYMAYMKNNFPNTRDFQCHVETLNQSGFTNSSSSQLSTFSNGANLRTYRFAVAATGEYTSFHGGTVAAGMAAIVTMTNRLNTVYEIDLAIRFVLVANTDQLIFTNGATDPFTNNSAGALIGESQTQIDAIIGSANYDIGHTVSTGGGGLASLAVICQTGSKARGITGLPSPIGDPFYIDFVAHEVGHQFAGNHTFNGSAGNCSGGNRNGSTAYEPGSGSTIQAYAGICSPQDLQNNSDAYFHTISLEEMFNHSTSGSGNNCPVVTATGNTPPVASHSMATGLTIPANTPFELTGNITDADGDAVTYCWEEFDLGSQGAPESPSGNAPIFRSWSPTTEPIRTFPRLSDLIVNTTTYGELLPTYTRSLNFRLTARDNRAGGGGIHCISYGVSVDAGSGPFIVTSPTNVGVIWTEAGSETVTWNVAGTAVAPVSCTNVDILLSIDGGLTYPFTVASSVANDGNENITVPVGSVSTTARIKVKCSSNVFFDISNNDFEIEAGVPDFDLSVTDTSKSICVAGNAVYSIDILSIAGFTDTVTLSTTGLPGGVTDSFATNPVNSLPSTTNLTIDNTSGLLPNTYSFTLVGTSTTGPKNIMLELVVLPDVPENPDFISPLNGATEVGVSTFFSWNSISNVSGYDFELSDTSSFGSSIQSGMNITDTSFTVASALSLGTVYYARVRANSICGSSSWITLVYRTQSPEGCNQVLADTSFESGNNTSWSEFSSKGRTIIDNSSGVYHTGVWSAWLGGANNETSEIWQSVSINSLAGSANLSYYYNISSNEAGCTFDIGNVLINGEIVTQYGLCPDNQNGWQPGTIDLSAHIGTTVEIRFRVTTDFVLQSSFFIDDVTLEVCGESTSLCFAPPTAVSSPGLYVADMECTDASGWTHYWKQASSAPVTPTDVLLLSIEKDDTVDISPSQVVIGLDSSGAIDLSSLPYVTNSDGWYVINRYWNVSPTAQPGSQGVNVRFYYPSSDFDEVNEAISNSAAAGMVNSHNDLVFYKFSSGSGVNPDPGIGNPHLGGNSSNYIELPHIANSYNLDHSAEFHALGFSGGGGGAGGNGGGVGALPVELVDFSASLNSDNNVDILWETASEINNNHFEIEWSSDGARFEKIFNVEPKSALGASYWVQHKDLAQGYNYYRLVQYDNNGRFEIFPVEEVFVENINSINKFNIYPVPTSNLLFVETEHSSFTYTIYDIKGAFLMTGNGRENMTQINLDIMEQGAYIIHLLSETETQILRFVKQ